VAAPPPPPYLIFTCKPDIEDVLVKVKGMGTPSFTITMSREEEKQHGQFFLYFGSSSNLRLNPYSPGHCDLNEREV
jgi:hypothetical protein